mmetsp:Transcript_21710/g.32072  ORF Transcript_21710/g.32072 Transcript_21710/m.32072 type:complete len:217 (-) Transcript_21710:549-1199(-)
MPKKQPRSTSMQFYLLLTDARNEIRNKLVNRKILPAVEKSIYDNYYSTQQQDRRRLRFLIKPISQKEQLMLQFLNEVDAYLHHYQKEMITGRNKNKRPSFTHNQKFSWIFCSYIQIRDNNKVNTVTISDKTYKSLAQLCTDMSGIRDSYVDKKGLIGKNSRKKKSRPTFYEVEICAIRNHQRRTAKKQRKFANRPSLPRKSVLKKSPLRSDEEFWV